LKEVFYKKAFSQKHVIKHISILVPVTHKYLFWKIKKEKNTFWM